MNHLWKLRIKKSSNDAYKIYRRKKFLIFSGCVLLVLHLIFPQYLKRLIYPYLFGKKSVQVQEISQEDFFEDLDAVPFKIQREHRNYLLVPKVKYSVTGRIGIVDHYDGWWTRIYRGQNQGKYIDLVPRDIVLVIGKMAQPDVFKLFEFEHEERMGRVLCKGVKYQKSFMSAHYIDEKEAKISEENSRRCDPYMNMKEQNNYHPIPANEKINKALSMLLKGDVVTLEGILVDVPELGLSTGTRKEQFHDKWVIAGQKAYKCFVLYTTRVIVNGVVYE